MNNIVFVSDFFLEQGVLGGAEKFNDALIKELLSKGYSVQKIISKNFKPQHISSDVFYIISNFMTLNEDCKQRLTQENYIIIEHDHKYLRTNDPSKFKNMIAPQMFVINQYFYEHAQAVYCQSKKHAETLQKNIFLENIINLGCNIWSDEDLSILEKFIDNEKTKENVVLYSSNKNKGTKQTSEFCSNKNISFEYIMPSDYETFISNLSKSKTLYFFPQWLESFNRVSVEARILGCKVVTNKLVGATSEPWFKETKGRELLGFIKEQREVILSKFLTVLEDGDPDFFEYPKIPKVSIITSMYKAGEYIEHFMSEVTKQTIFGDCELIILDANSPDGEKTIIDKYLKKYDNIIYHRLKETLSVQETMNIGLEMASGEYITLWNVDDTRHYNALKILAHHLNVDTEIDLVYTDSCQTHQKNETFEKNTSRGYRYEHSGFDFSKRNMIKCLPGPLPMWRKEMTQKNGKFDESLKYAGDWEMWLRCVQAGSKFKRIHKILGLYYMNPDGLSTSRESQKERFKEEREIFNKYKNVFGQEVYNQFKGYFNG